MTAKRLLRQSLGLLVLACALALTISLANNDKARALQTEASSSQLEQGSPINRETGDGQTHSFRVDMKAGEFLHVFIRQLGVNVAATLIAPDGTKVLEADVPRSTQEPEWITHVAGPAGKYLIQVRTVDRGALKGRFEISIDEKRQRAADDETRLAAQRSFTDGTQLFNEKNYKGSVEKYEQALALYRQSGRKLEQAVTLNCLARSSASFYDYQTAIARSKEALSIYRDIGDVHGEGITLHGIGSAYLSISRYEEAISSFEQALEARKKVHYRAGEAGTIRNLGIVYSLLGRQQRAIDHFENSLAIFRELNDRAEEGRTLNNIGLAYNTLSRYEKAIEYYQQALAISRELKDRTGEGRALGNLGKVYSDLSRHDQAIEYTGQALAIYRDLKDRQMEGVALNNIGNSYNSWSRYEIAIQYLDQALTVSREAKDQPNEGRALTNLGNAYYLLSQYEKAIAYYQQALDLKRRIKDRRGEGLTLGNLAIAYNSLGQHERAREYLEQALTIKKEVKDRAGEAATLVFLGDVYFNLAQYEKAIMCYEQGLTVSLEVKARSVEAGSLWGLGKANDSLMRNERAIDYYQQSLAVSREVKDPAGQGRTLRNLMLVWERLNNSSLAILYGKQAVNVFQEIRGNIRTLDAESRLSYLKSHEDAYRKLANLLISEGRLAEAEKVLELLKDEEFNRIASRNGPLEPDIALTKSEAEAAKVTDQLAQLASERGPLLAKIANKTATDQDRERLDLIESTITEANKKMKFVLTRIAKTSADEKLVTQQSQSMMQSLRKLGPGTVALYTVMGNDKGWVILTTSDFRRAYPINTVNLNKTISDFRMALKDAQHDPVPLAQKLYRALFRQRNDVGATLAGDLKAYKATTLMWSLDGVLRYLPIGALHDGKAYLVENYSNLVFTTASLTRLLDSAEGAWRAFGLGVSKQHKDFPALAFVTKELHSIIREEGGANSTGVLPGVIRLDEQFTRQTMIDGLREGYPVVHIASHFRFVPGRVEVSYLLLGDGSTLSLQEMQNSPGIFERVELLTLSACETALGANGKEVEGLAFVAQDLGAKAVVASLWQVADEGTEVLMREFYRLKEANPQWSKIEALRHAQIALLKGSATGSKLALHAASANETEGAMKPFKRDAKERFAHPHYWAPFILIGNWK